MKLRSRQLSGADEFWRVRNFFRELFLLHGRQELSWHVARLDYWRWHFIMNIKYCPPAEEVMVIWETNNSHLAAVVHPFGMNEAFLAIHPDFRTQALEHEMIEYAERHFTLSDESGLRKIFISANDDDPLRQQVLEERGYMKRKQMIHRYWRDLVEPVESLPETNGYVVRPLGGFDELPARSWASWRAFHPDEPVEDYEGWEWYLNLQAAPLYRRDLDIVAATPAGEVASFCTIYYDDFTRSGVCVLVGTAAEHQKRGLGKAVVTEGLRRIRMMGGTRIFANAYDLPADALYSSVLKSKAVSHSWLKKL